MFFCKNGCKFDVCIGSTCEYIRKKISELPHESYVIRSATFEGGICSGVRSPEDLFDYLGPYIIKCNNKDISVEAFLKSSTDNKSAADNVEFDSELGWKIDVSNVCQKLQ